MQAIRLKALGVIIAVVAAVVAALGQPAAAQDKVKVGVFPTASSLPYFVAIERGFFKEQNIEPETIRLIGGPPNIAAMISNQIEAAVVLVTIEAMNANLKKPGVAMYIGVHSQSKIYQMEQFVVRTGYAAATLKDLKGARIMSAPGPANLVAAKAVLAKVGLNEGDYTIDQLDMSQHVNVALLHGGRAHRQAQGRVPEIHRFLHLGRHAAGESRHHQISAGVLKYPRTNLCSAAAAPRGASRATRRHPARYASRTCGSSINSRPLPSIATEPDSRR